MYAYMYVYMYKYTSVILKVSFYISLGIGQGEDLGCLQPPCDEHIFEEPHMRGVSSFDVSRDFLAAQPLGDADADMQFAGYALLLLLVSQSFGKKAGTLAWVPPRTAV